MRRGKSTRPIFQESRTAGRPARSERSERSHFIKSERKRRIAHLARGMIQTFGDYVKTKELRRMNACGVDEKNLKHVSFLETEDA